MEGIVRTAMPPRPHHRFYTILYLDKSCVKDKKEYRYTIGRSIYPLMSHSIRYRIHYTHNTLSSISSRHPAPLINTDNVHYLLYHKK